MEADVWFRHLFVVVWFGPPVWLFLASRRRFSGSGCGMAILYVVAFTVGGNKMIASTYTRTPVLEGSYKIRVHGLSPGMTFEEANAALVGGKEALRPAAIIWAHGVRFEVVDGRIVGARFDPRQPWFKENRDLIGASEEELFSRVPEDKRSRADALYAKTNRGRVLAELKEQRIGTVFGTMLTREGAPVARIGESLDHDLWKQLSSERYHPEHWGQNHTAQISNPTLKQEENVEVTIFLDRDRTIQGFCQQRGYGFIVPHLPYISQSD